MALGGGKQKIASMVPHLVKTLRKQPLRPTTTNHTLPSLRRTFSLYDQINLIDTVPDDQLRFQGYSDTGFTINGTKYEGSLLIVENKIMTWSPKKFSDITPQSDMVYQQSILFMQVIFLLQLETYKHWCFYHLCSLSIFQVVRPVPEILILGCGRNIFPVDPELRRFIRSTGMKLEAIDSRNASSTYNILNEEGRHVAAALLPYGVES
ncbi:hypothetical protein LUZ61_018750 [Rhynchospora tenuis]|uniref:NADH dehydrogenase [ubiquinone] 1 alpha subcomplex assembly factor 3 n=1 Tax=Rhynchospora tenuis TaxID=198213 RepID=A0AAD5Z9Z9_9POAL|nr:hypothetical protein LUZ61_018750 [Rhynchospora tenuis]